jgi:hypothetical protein
MEKIMNFNHNEAMACQDMEAHQEERKPTSPDRKLEAAQEDEVPAEDTTVMPVREPKKKRCRDRTLATECRCQKPNRHGRMVYPRKNWLPPAGKCPAVQQWHGARGTSSRKI